MLVIGRGGLLAKENFDVERRPRLTALAAVNTLSRELIVPLILALAALMLPACGGPQVILKSPLGDKCKEAALKKC